ncbi:MAG: tetratricopeptide repeat protein [Thermoguttaceae bacterium]
MKFFWTFLMAIAVTFLFVQTSQGRGGGGGFHGSGGFHGGGSFGGGGYHGGEFHGGSVGGYHGEYHSPSFNEPRFNEGHFQPEYSHWNGGGHAAFTPHTGPGPHPWGPGPHPGPNPSWYHGPWNNHWNHPWNYWPAGWWGAGFAAGALFDTAPWGWGYWPYVNPYCTGPVVVEGTTMDYSQPLVLASTDDAGSQQPDAQSTDDQVSSLLDGARDAFQQEDYAGALRQCNNAIAVQPDNRVAHEFRGLALFALHHYTEAAGAIYAVLSAGPGWDWTTLSGLYSDVSVYTDQLRALEQYVTANPNQAAARFLLGYQYMVCGHNEAAARQFKSAAKLNPKDTLSSQLAAMLTPTATESPAPAKPAKPAQPVDPASLLGTWKATRSDGATIALELGKDGQYVWQFDQQGKTRKFAGAYTVADGLLILKKGDSPVMVGQVTSLSDGGFNFKLPGDNPNDPGLSFRR